MSKGTECRDKRNLYDTVWRISDDNLINGYWIEKHNIKYHTPLSHLPPAHLLMWTDTQGVHQQ